MRKDKIAVMIPVFNAGSLLMESIASVTAGLRDDAYEIIVTDNNSDDGSIEALPLADSQGVPIHIRRNGSNLGRVQNWNRALDAAEEMGFGHAMFLMAGDLISGNNVLLLRQRMRETGAVLGLGSFDIMDEDLRLLRSARRIVWRAKAGISASRFLTQSFGIGGMLLAPLGANLYDLSGPRLHFDPDDPSHTDQAATAEFLRTSGRPVIYLDRPITQWRRRAGRFHSGMNLAQRLADDLMVIRRVCSEAGVVPDPRKIQCTLILRIIFHTKGNISAAWPHLQSLVRDRAPIDWPFLFVLLLRQLNHKTPWLISD